MTYMKVGHGSPVPRSPSSLVAPTSTLSLNTQTLETATARRTLALPAPSPLVSPTSGSSSHDAPRTPDPSVRGITPPTTTTTTKLTTLPASLHICLRPIPHAVLPPPFADFCLTPYLSSDADDMYELLNHPLVGRGLGVRPNAPFTRADASRTVRRAREKGHGWPLNALRRTDSLRTDHFPPLLGCITLARDNYRSLPHALGERLRFAERAKADQDAHWAMQFSVDPALQGRGVMSAALRFVLSAWFIPIIAPYPGQLTTTFPAAALRAQAHPSRNGGMAESPVARIHSRLGFVPLGSVRGDTWSIAGPDDEVVCCAWMGAGAVPLEGSVWRGLGLVPFSFDEEDGEGDDDWESEVTEEDEVDGDVGRAVVLDDSPGASRNADHSRTDTDADDRREASLEPHSSSSSPRPRLIRDRGSSVPHSDMDVDEVEAP